MVLQILKTCLKIYFHANKDNKITIKDIETRNKLSYDLIKS